MAASSSSFSSLLLGFESRLSTIPSSSDEKDMSITCLVLGTSSTLNGTVGFSLNHMELNMCTYVETSVDSVKLQ